MDALKPLGGQIPAPVVDVDYVAGCLPFNR